MKTKIIYSIVIALALIVFISLVATKDEGVMLTGLPPRTVCASLADAKASAEAYYAAHGGIIMPIAGTGSMAPYIPAAAKGADPMAVIAYAVTDPSIGYDQIQKGQLVIYAPGWTSGSVIHQAAEKDADGWIMSGLHNAHYESRWRVSSFNFTAVGGAVFTVVP